MGHITHPPPTPPQGRGAERLYYMVYKTYKTHKTHKPYTINKPFIPPLGGTEGGFLSGASHIVEMGITQLQGFQLLVGLLHESLVLI